MALNFRDIAWSIAIALAGVPVMSLLNNIIAGIVARNMGAL